MKNFVAVSKIYRSVIGKKRFDALSNFLQKLSKNELRELIARCESYKSWVSIIDFLNKFITIILVFFSTLLVVYSIFFQQLNHEEFMLYLNIFLQGSLSMYICVSVPICLVILFMAIGSLKYCKYQYIITVCNYCLHKNNECQCADKNADIIK